MGRCAEPAPGSAGLSAAGEEGMEGKDEHLAGAAEPATFRSGAGRGQLSTSSWYNQHHACDLRSVKSVSHDRTGVVFESV